MGKLNGKVALITGGNSGIGLASALLFQKEGAQVVITGRDEKTLREAGALLGKEALVLKSDVSRLDEIDLLYREVKNKFGGIDVLFANAGIANFLPLEKVDEAYFVQMMDINVKGLYFTVQKSLPLLKPGASVILTGSSINLQGRPGGSVYAATKAAVRSLARSFSSELVDRNVRVNALSPGPVSTPIFERMKLPPEQFEAMMNAKRIPVKRFGTPEELAKVALFLASDDSSYLLGSEIFVDGGIAQL